MECPNYFAQRDLLLEELQNFLPLSFEQLLFGKNTLDDTSNAKILLSVQKYIKHSKRFSQ